MKFTPLANEKKSPLVSVVIPHYNHFDYVEKAIESVLIQTYKNYEIIIIDDCSHDQKKFLSLQQKYKDRKFIKFFKNNENIGTAATINRALDIYKGDYFSWLSSDDYYDKNKLLYQLNSRKNQDQVIYCDIYNIKGKKTIKKFNSSVENQNFYWWLLLSDKLHGCSLLIPRKIIESVGYFRPELKFVHDYEYWLRISHHYHYVYCKYPLVYSLEHEAQTSKLKVNEVKKEKTKFYIKYVRKNFFLFLYKKNYLMLFKIFYSFASRDYLYLVYFLKRQYKIFYLNSRLHDEIIYSFFINTGHLIGRLKSKLRAILVR